MKRLLHELRGKDDGPFVLYVDNKSALALTKSPVFHGRSKHIDTRFHFTRECVEEGLVNVQHVSTIEQLMKALPRVIFQKMSILIGVRIIDDTSQN